MTQSDIATIASIIQLAVAPVFLLTGIAGLLSVLSQRLGRIVDRSRVIERQLLLPQLPREELRGLLQHELEAQWIRIRLVNWAIRLCVSCALCICIVIATLFVGDIMGWNISLFIGGMFVGAMLLIIGGLLLFLLEVSVSTLSMRASMSLVLEEH